MEYLGCTPESNTVFTLDPSKFSALPSLPLREVCQMQVRTIHVPYIPYVEHYLYDVKGNTWVVSGLVISNGETVKVHLSHWGDNWTRHVRK